LNQKIISYLTNVTASTETLDLNQKFSYAASYEDFIKIIKSSKNVEEIKQFHYKIKNEILQATLINDLRDGKLTDNLSKKSSAPIAVNTNSNLGTNSFIASGSSSFYASFSNTRVTESDINNSSKNDMLRSKYLKRLKYASLICERRLESLKSSLSSDEKLINELNLEKNFKDRKVNLIFFLFF